MGIFNEIDFVRNEIEDIANVEKKPSGGIRSFGSRIGYAISLGLKENEIFFFGLLQWAAIGIGYLLWVQIFDWLPNETMGGVFGSDEGSTADWIFLAWSLACVGAVAFPVGILTGCMGAAHFLHKQGRESSIATCFKLVLPQSWPLWSFHWIDGLITVRQILERLPKKDDESTLGEKAWGEASYYAWKLAVAGVLPGIVTGNSLIQSGKNSVIFVKENLLEVAKLRAGYSILCWIVGIGAFVGAILFLAFSDLGPKGDETYTIALWAGIPIAVAVSVVMLLLRPIYVLALCDLYSDHLARRGVVVNPPDGLSAKSRNAIAVFLCLCAILVAVYLYHAKLWAG